MVSKQTQQSGCSALLTAFAQMTSDSQSESGTLRWPSQPAVCVAADHGEMREDGVWPHCKATILDAAVMTAN